MNVRIQRERDAQFGRERALVEMRAAVVAAVGSPHVGRLGSLAVLEAVDEALAQIVAAGEHVGESAHVKALWITYATRRLIDERRSAEVRHRDGAAGREPGRPLTGSPCGDPPELTEDGRERWRIREILSVLRDEERRWAEAWFEEILVGSRPAGVQPRGLPEKLGWSASKTKSVSRRARRKMGAFIHDRVSGTVCAEQRTLLDALIGTAGRRGGPDLAGELYASTLLHIAGCEDCWTAWRARRRSLLGRSSAAFLVPIDAVALAGHALAAKLTGVALGTHAQASALLARLGIGGAAAAGGAGATLGGKATAVCVGVVCAAATVGGEITGVLPAIVPERVRDGREAAAPPERAPSRADAATRVAQAAATKVTAPVAPAAPAVPPTAPAKAAASAALRAAKALRVRGAPGDLPPADAPSAQAVAPPPPPPATDPAATFSAAQSGAPLTPPPAAASASTSSPKCVPGDLGC